MSDIERLLTPGSRGTQALEEGISRLRGLPSETLSSDEAATWHGLSSQFDSSFTVVLERAAQEAAQRADSQAADLSQQVETSSLLEGVGDTFLTEFVAETKKQIKSAACDTILNALAPEQRSKARPQSSDGGAGTSARDYAGAALDALRSRYSTASLKRVVDWVTWFQKVLTDGQQVSGAVEANPSAYVMFANQPAVQRGVYAYIKFCYAPPGSG